MLEKNIRISKNEIVYGVALFLLVFQSVLENYVSAFKYLDELLAGGMFLCGIYVWIKKGHMKLSKMTLIFIVGILLFAIMGTISTVIFQYQSVKISISQFLLSIKYFLLMIGTMSLGRYTDFKYVFDVSKMISRGLLIVVAIWQMLSYFMDSIVAFSAWDLCGKVVFLLCIIFWTYSRGVDSIYILLGCILLISTEKGKAAGAVLLVLALYMIVIKLYKRIKVATLATLGVGMLVVAWEKIALYFIKGIQYKYARATLFADGVKVANEYFPFGTGWGTFGSYFAAVEYSPVYYALGWDKLYDLNPKRWYFLMDTYWPSVYAESGWIGFAGLFVALLVVYILIQKRYKKSRYQYAAGMLAFGYMMITTVEETGFAQPVLMPLAIALGLLCVRDTYKKEKKES